MKFRKTKLQQKFYASQYFHGILCDIFSKDTKLTVTLQIGFTFFVVLVLVKTTGQ